MASPERPDLAVAVAAARAVAYRHVCGVAPRAPDVSRTSHAVTGLRHWSALLASRIAFAAALEGSRGLRLNNAS